MSLIQTRVGISSDIAAKTAVERKLLQHPPSVYTTGAVILLKYKGKDTRLIRGGRHINTPRTVEAKVVDRNLKKHLYKVSFMTLDHKEVTEWRKVDNITSLTRIEELKRQVEVKKKGLYSKFCLFCSS